MTIDGHTPVKLGVSTMKNASRKVAPAIAVALALVAAAIASLAAPGSAAAGSTPFVAAGTIVDSSAPMEPTPFEGQQAAFLLGSLTEVSDTASPHVENGQLKVHVTPATRYYRYEPSIGTYRSSDYAGTVVEGERARTYGRYTDGPDGPVFFATYIWNPPTDPTEGSFGSVPKCDRVGKGTTFRPFMVVATILHNRVTVPCTGFGGVPAGFSLADGSYTETSLGFDEAIVDFGGVVQIYEIAGYTQYIIGDKFTTNRVDVVRDGVPVRVYGRWAHVNGGWLLYARYIWTPPPNLPTELRVDTNVNALRTAPGQYSGVSNGRDFDGGNFQATLSWTPTSDGNWTVAGTWELRVNASHLSGDLQGELRGSTLSLLLNVTTGSGAYAGYRGGGTISGTATVPPGEMSPSALQGHVDLILATTAS